MPGLRSRRSTDQNQAAQAEVGPANARVIRPRPLVLSKLSADSSLKTATESWCLAPFERVRVVVTFQELRI